MTRTSHPPTAPAAGSKVSDRPSGSAGTAPALSPRIQGLLLVGACAAVALVVMAAHWPVLDAQAICFDDDQYVISNPLVRNPSWYSVGRFLAEVLTPSTVEGYYQPLTMISLMLDYVFGAKPNDFTQFHRTNLVLHVAVTVLIVVLLYQLFGQVWPAAIVGLVFGVHPMTVESTTWVNDRKTLLASMFAVASLIAYVRWTRNRGRGVYATAVVMFVLSLLSKPTSTLLPVAMLLLDFWPLHRLSWKAVWEKIPFYAVTLASGIITFISQARTSGVELPQQGSKLPVFYHIPHNIVFYLNKILWPKDLSPFYAIPEPMSLSHPAVLAGVIGTALLVPLLVLSLTRTRALLTGWLIFFVIILPTMGGVGFTIVVASDKYAYLPMIGFLITLCGLLAQLWISPLKPGEWPWPKVAAAAVALVVIGAEITVMRAYREKWNTSESLCQHMIRHAPRGAPIYGLYGEELFRQRRFAEAIEACTKGVELRPSFRSHTNLSNALMAVGRFQEALEHSEKAFACMPDSPTAHYNLANAQAQAGKLDEAIANYRKALELRPGYTQVYNNLALTLMRQDKFDEALPLLEQAVRHHPDNASAWANLGMAQVKKGQLDASIESYGKAVALDGRNPNPRYVLAQLLAVRGRLGEAIAQCRAVLALEPNHPEVKPLLERLIQVQATRPGS